MTTGTVALVCAALTLGAAIGAAVSEWRCWRFGARARRVTRRVR